MVTESLHGRVVCVVGTGSAAKELAVVLGKSSCCSCRNINVENSHFALLAHVCSCSSAVLLKFCIAPRSSVLLGSRTEFTTSSRTWGFVACFRTESCHAGRQAGREGEWSIRKCRQVESRLATPAQLSSLWSVHLKVLFISGWNQCFGVWVVVHFRFEMNVLEFEWWSFFFPSMV